VTELRLCQQEIYKERLRWNNGKLHFNTNGPIICMGMTERIEFMYCRPTAVSRKFDSWTLMNLWTDLSGHRQWVVPVSKQLDLALCKWVEYTYILLIWSYEDTVKHAKTWQMQCAGQQGTCCHLQLPYTTSASCNHWPISISHLIHDVRSIKPMYKINRRR